MTEQGKKDHKKAIKDLTYEILKEYSSFRQDCKKGGFNSEEALINYMAVKMASLELQIKQIIEIIKS